MASRYSIGIEKEVFESRFSVDATDNYGPRYNAAPTQILPVITNTAPEGVSFLYWGVQPGWTKNKSISNKLIQVHANRIRERTALQKNLIQRRCIIPANGYFEWKNITKKRQIPYRVFMNIEEVFSMAGIWEEYEDENENLISTFKVIVADANEVTAELSEIMPVIFTKEEEKIWLNADSKIEDLLALLQTPSAENLTKHTISPRINSLENDGADLLLHAQPADQFGNYSLFD